MNNTAWPFETSALPLNEYLAATIPVSFSIPIVALRPAPCSPSPDWTSRYWKIMSFEVSQSTAWKLSGFDEP